MDEFRGAALPGLLKRIQSDEKVSQLIELASSGLS